MEKCVRVWAVGEVNEEVWGSAGEMWREVWGCKERCGKCVGGVGKVIGEL